MFSNLYVSYFLALIKDYVYVWSIFSILSTL